MQRLKSIALVIVLLLMDSAIAQPPIESSAHEVRATVPVGGVELVPLDFNAEPTGLLSNVADCHFVSDATSWVCDSGLPAAFRVLSSYKKSDTVYAGSAGLVAKTSLPNNTLEAFFLATDAVVSDFDPNRNALDAITLSRGPVAYFRNATVCYKVSRVSDPNMETHLKRVSIAVVRCLISKRDADNYAFVSHATPLLPRVTTLYSPVMGIAFGGNIPAAAFNNLFAADGFPTLHSGAIYELNDYSGEHSSPSKMGFEGHLLLTRPYRFSGIHIGAIGQVSRNMFLHTSNPGFVCPYLRLVFPQLSWSEQARLRDYLVETREVVQTHCRSLEPALSASQYIYSFFISVVPQDEL